MSTAKEPLDLTVSDDDLTVSEEDVAEEPKCATRNLGGSKRAAPTDYSSPVIEIPLVDGFYQAQLNAFDEHYHDKTKTIRRTVPTPLSVGMSYAEEVSPTIQERLPTRHVCPNYASMSLEELQQQMAAYGMKNHSIPREDIVKKLVEMWQKIRDMNKEKCPVHVIGNTGLQLIWTKAANPFRVNVETGVLSDLLEKVFVCSLDDEETSEYDKWFLQYKWCTNHCVVGANKRTQFRGTYGENRLWKALAHHMGNIDGVDIKHPVPCVIRSWYHPKILEDILKCVGKERILTAIRIMSRNNWLGCPDLFLWKGGSSECMFVEVKSSTDRMKWKQTLLKRELESAGFTYQIAVTEDVYGIRVITREVYEEHERKRRKYDSETDEDYVG